MQLDSTDKKLLNLVQRDFPLTREPYADLGRQLAIARDEVIHRLEQLKANGMIRQISPVLDAGSLGYRTTLVAMRVDESRRDKAEQVISAHPRVSHGYQRDNCLNIWFTLASPPGANLDSELEKLTAPIGAEAVIALPAIKVFKLNVYFDINGEGQAAGAASTDSRLTEAAELSPADRQVINGLQQDLPLTPEPFVTLAGQVGMDVADFLDRCQSLQERGIMRRFGASLDHHQAGFNANAMTCWRAPADTVDAAGYKLAELPEVSHCYERKTSPLWQYNLYAMIHSHSQEECRQIASKASRQIGLNDYVQLFSTKEFKKVRNIYPV